MIILKKIYVLISLIIICSIILNCSIYYKEKTVAVSSESLKTDETLTVIIDAGHGGFDGGTSTSDGYPEKDINLSISLFLRDYLNLFGVNNVLTREDDSSLEDDGLNTIRERKVSDIHNRMKLMEETDNAVFVSIHQNYYYDTQYSGAQVFYTPELPDASSSLAQCVQDSIVFDLQPQNTRLIKECGSSVYLMYNAVKPAVLVECGFLSNKAESELLKTDEYQKAMALCIALGIIDFIW